jgi:hypothetical protein
LPQLRTRLDAQASALGFDGIQFPDSRQRLLGNRIGLRGIEIEVLAPRVGQTSKLNDACGKQRLVARVTWCTT